MSDYGDVAGVAAYVRHMTFGQPNNPTEEQVETWLVARSAQLTGWLAAAGYTVPVSVPSAKAVLDRYANVGAACDAELAQRTGGYGAVGKPEQNRRESRFCAEFMEAAAWIAGGALLALGVPQVLIGSLAAAQPAIGIIAAGTADDASIAMRPPEWLR